jgi:hypothetical protein
MTGYDWVGRYTGGLAPGGQKKSAGRGQGRQLGAPCRSVFRTMDCNISKSGGHETPTGKL